ncbi:ShlB/FhaC/HecB family hemolysin secretion/activation protein [Azohydromonas lata]|uniref:ShlB/FhaC/HecB family hemolysin secretion/activation protein n=1 Tax=Azohydromonas lata TaxID=45677 RepID=UPI00083479AC|nr:ShlB/FhaC/HecB family hemolysin secretion/activation protein [Azohydromonas lata]
MSHSLPFFPAGHGSRPALLAAALAAAVWALPAAAQPVPDAGQVLRDLRPPVEQVPRGGATLTVPADTDTSADQGQRFAVRTLRIEGVRSLDEAEVRALVAPLEGTQASLGELRQAAQRITRFYRERGFIVARAYLPAQQVVDGAVTISVLESSLNTFSFDNRSGMQEPVMAAVVQSQDLLHKPIVADSMDRTLLLLADLPGVGNVSGNLKPGQQVGTSDMVISVEPGKAVEGDVSLDNHGNRYTGAQRLNGHVMFNNPRGVGDRLDLRATVTNEQLLSGRAAYDLPLSDNGLRGGVAASYSRYELGREFARLDAFGSARSVTAYAAWPLLRGLTRNVWLSGSIEYRDLHDVVRSTGTTTDKQAQAGNFEAYGDWADALAGGGYSTWRVGGTVGHLDIQTPAARASDEAGPKAGGGYSKLQLGLSRLQTVTSDVTLSVSASAQTASKNLDSSEKFVVGGAYGVRAYPQGEGVGDEGWLASIELRRPLSAQWQASVFYDVGGVHYSKTPYAAGRNQQTLRGMGVGVAGQWSNGAYVRTSVAWRDGEASITAPDHNPRLWVTAGWRF